MNPTVHLGTLLRQFELNNRQAQYVLESGFAPAGLDASPAPGNYRQFDGQQAFWLVLALKAKECGLKTAVAAKAADFACEGVRTVTQNLNYDRSFLPHNGQFDTMHEYILEIASGRYAQLVTNAAPSSGGKLESLGWREMGKRNKMADLRPYVVIQLRISDIAKGLAPLFNAANPCPPARREPKPPLRATTSPYRRAAREQAGITGCGGPKKKRTQPQNSRTK